MKMMKKSLSVILAVLMMFTVSAFAFAAEGDITVSVRVEGIDKCFYYGDVQVPAGSSALDAIDAADAKSDAITVTHIIGDWGPYITEINGLKAGSQTKKGWDGWNYAVNGEAPNFGVAAYKVSADDDIVVYYADGDKPAQIPVVNTDNLNQGKISFTSMDTTYPAPDYLPVTTENPVKDYKLTWYDHNRTVVITPDENGVCTIPPEYNLKGAHRIQIEKYDETTGLPLVLRYASDFTVNVADPENFISQFYSFWYMIIDFIYDVIYMIRDLIASVQ